MKLRVRSLETKETLRIEVPDPCSLQHFKDAISQRLSASSPPVHLSLNRKDELQSASPQDPLRSLGITSGDLIFYTLDPHGFSRPVRSAPSQTAGSQPQSLETARGEEISGEGSQVLESEMTGEDKSSDLDRTQKVETPNFDAGDGEAIEYAGMDVDRGSDSTMGKGFSVPSFLRKVLMEEFVHGDECGRKLLVVAVHAVLLESGFIGFDPLSRTSFERFRLPDGWPSSAFTISLSYTLPELLARNSGIETVVLKFRNLGKFVSVYGHLARSGSGLYRVYLDEHRFGPSINSVWKNPSRPSNTLSATQTSTASSPENEAFEFWKIVKDGLALPLMINICESSGLDFPPCLMRLPTELKLKILECLPGHGIAMMECACSEFRYLSAHNDLWERKFVEEFRNSALKPEWLSWKESFALSWAAKKETEDSDASRRYRGMLMRRFFPNPLFSAGGRDRYRSIFASPAQGDRLFRHNPRMFPFSPQCHLGEGEYESDT